jgi:phage gp36-like protein
MNAQTGDAASIRADIARRWRDVDEEIRHYPTPIARCDVQLTALIETRDELRVLRALDDDAQLIDAYASARLRWAQQ